MYQDIDQNLISIESLSRMGTDAVAYMRKISAEEINEKFPEVAEIEAGQVYWAMFAADGTPLLLASDQADLAHSAYYNDLKAVLPN